ncbi:TPA: CpaF family protein [Candidatus Woesearchaeota archaeon]|nr:CpaF family protein [Candidatus Woesearchaeota archaeon]HIH91178.1 CpaF family protein [Candidatus Woesearchaeota archaeon]HII64759.1 CpaF family protein [Candidatus Woesearchaeota archaeon]
MDSRVLEAYDLVVNRIVVKVSILAVEQEAVPLYTITVTNISETTKIILEKIREEFISGAAQDLEDFDEDISRIQEQFKARILVLLKKYFPTADEKTQDMLINYMIQQNIGLGNLEILLKDPNLEEIVVNNSHESVWIYHRKRGWCKTNIRLPDEPRIRHYSTIIGRDVGKEITTLTPLMDAHLRTGDRINATLSPISSKGNTITIRKFAVKPWTMTDFLKDGVLSYEAAALLWVAVQHELSFIIAGGTGSGKTSMLNVISTFLPPNQRIISIEDTREVVLPEILHWVPMETRLANPEGKGGITMLDLIVNSLRMRPDRIIVGEIRRREEAEVLFEAMRTGHSVYATLHANNAHEVVNRLTTRPIDIPKEVLSALSLAVVQNINRKTGRRRTLQIAEILPSGEPRIIMQLNPLRGQMEYIAEPLHVFGTISLYTGLSKEEIIQDLRSKVKVLQWMVEKNINDVNKIGLIMSRYYQNKPFQHIL